MPKQKLKHALLAQQSSAALAASRKKAEMAKKARDEAIARSIRTNGSSSKAKKKRPASSSTAANAGLVGSRGEEIATGDSQGSVGAHGHSKAKGKETIPFDKQDTILLLGEANFSFAISLISHHGHPASRLCATNYDTQEVCFRKYPDAEANVLALQNAGVRVEFGIDAGKLDTYKWIGKGRWSRVIFNFPHAGAGITDQDRNILTNQILLLRTFRAVYPILTRGPSKFPIVSSSKGKQPPQHGKEKEMRGKANNKRKRAADSDDEDEVPVAEDEEHEGDNEDSAIMRLGADKEPPKREGTILITLLDQPPYSLWDVRKLAIRPPTYIPGDKSSQGECKRYRLLRSFAFSSTTYPGYAHRRTIGFKDGVSKAQNEEIEGRKGGARTWEFAPVPTLPTREVAGGRP